MANAVFVSTRNPQHQVLASEAIERGPAPDGGLYVPAFFPKLGEKMLAFSGSFPQFAAEVIRPFFKGDFLEKAIDDICHQAFSFSLPLFWESADKAILELFHGPTGAFKDFGARFLAGALERSPRKSARPLTILVATSGDTGGAVASAFYQKKMIEVFILFPRGRVSERQEKQLTCWGENIHSLQVAGSFDDCQALVKGAFADQRFHQVFDLTSANSINLGRLLPQMSYFYYASVEFLKKTGKRAKIIIPSGNVGNAVGAYWALEMGAPIEKIVLAVNANRPVVDYLATGEWKARESVPTLANAMDVGNPSNIERLRHLYPKFSQFKNKVSCFSVSDEEIRQTIGQYFEETQYLLCPHSAVAKAIDRQLFKEEATLSVATAHPAKFETIVEPLIGKVINIPAHLELLLERKSIYEQIAPDLESFYSAALKLYC